MKSSNFFIVLLIPSTLLFVGILPSSFSESHTIEQIIITIEPPHEEFEDTSDEKDENNNENSNNGGSGNAPTSFVTGSNYALNGIPILINTPEGVRLNDQLTDQRDLEKLEQIHGEKFWERVDKLTYDHYGLANAMFDPLTKNTFFANGGKYSENTNSNFEYYVLERGYDPREPHKVPNNLFTPTKYDLARAVMQKMQDNNANDLNIEKLNELNLEVISPHAFQMTEEQQNIIYHADIENRALSILKDVMPTISSDSNSDSQNTQNNVGNSNQPDSPLTSMPGNNDSLTTTPPLVNSLNEEIFQNTEHIKTVIGQEKFEPNYENHDELILPITEILLSLLLSTSVLIAIFVIRKMIKKQKQNIIIHTKNPELDYIAETQKLLDSAITLYNSHKIKDAYEKFSQSIRFFYSYHYGLTHEVTTFEILEKIKKLSITDYEIIHNCLVLCGIIEFAKHKENKNDFKIYTESFSKIITHTANTTKISGERK